MSTQSWESAMTTSFIPLQGNHGADRVFCVRAISPAADGPRPADRRGRPPSRRPCTACWRASTPTRETRSSADGWPASSPPSTGRSSSSAAWPQRPLAADGKTPAAAATATGDRSSPLPVARPRWPVQTHQIGFLPALGGGLRPPVAPGSRRLPARPGSAEAARPARQQPQQSDGPRCSARPPPNSRRPWPPRPGRHRHPNKTGQLLQLAQPCATTPR
jgi:hypothetical protein